MSAHIADKVPVYIMPVYPSNCCWRFFLLEGEISVGESFFSLSYDDDEFSLSIKHKLKVYLLIRVPDYKQHSNWMS